MSNQYRTSQEAFIAKHITAALSSDGFTEVEVKRGVQEAIRHYRETTSGKNKVFDECLSKARKLLSPAKKSATRNKRKGKAA